VAQATCSSCTAHCLFHRFNSLIMGSFLSRPAPDAKPTADRAAESRALAAAFVRACQADVAAKAEETPSDESETNAAPAPAACPPNIQPCDGPCCIGSDKAFDCKHDYKYHNVSKVCPVPECGKANNMSAVHCTACKKSEKKISLEGARCKWTPTVFARIPTGQHADRLYDVVDPDEMFFAVDDETGNSLGNVLIVPNFRVRDCLILFEDPEMGLRLVKKMRDFALDVVKTKWWDCRKSKDLPWKNANWEDFKSIIVEMMFFQVPPSQAQLHLHVYIPPLCKGKKVSNCTRRVRLQYLLGMLERFSKKGEAPDVQGMANMFTGHTRKSFRQSMRQLTKRKAWRKDNKYWVSLVDKTTKRFAPESEARPKKSLKQEKKVFYGTVGSPKSRQEYERHWADVVRSSMKSISPLTFGVGWQQSRTNSSRQFAGTWLKPSTMCSGDSLKDRTCSRKQMHTLHKREPTFQRQWMKMRPTRKNTEVGRHNFQGRERK